MSSAVPGGYQDQFYVSDKDPDYVYRFCNKDERAMLRHQANGYEAVTDRPDLIPTLPGQPAAPTTGTTVNRGHDLVLMKIPRARHEAIIEGRRKALRQQHEDAVDNAVENMNDKAMDAVRARTNQMPKKRLVFKETDAPSFSQDKE